jgi:hypothetical protein
LNGLELISPDERISLKVISAARVDGLDLTRSKVEEVSEWHPLQTRRKNNASRA